MSTLIRTVSGPGPRPVRTYATAELDELEAEWLALWESDPRATVFTHPGWYASYIAAFQSTEPLLIVQRGEGGELLAIWPFEKRGRSIVFLSEPRADYARPTVAPGADLASLIDAMLGVVRATAPGHRLLLREFRSDDPIPELLAAHAAARGYHSGIQLGNLCVRLSLAVEPDGFQKRFMESKERKKALKRLAKHGEYRWERLTDPDEMLSALPDLFALHTRRWAAEGSTFLAEAPVQRFYAELARRLPSGFVYLARLTLGGRPIAVDYHFAYRGTLAHSTPVFNAAYADLSPGFVMLSSIGEDIMRGGFQELDFLRGGENYKLRFANASGHNRSVLLFPHAADQALHGAAERLRATIERQLHSRPRLRQRVRLLRAAAAQYGYTGAARRAAQQALGTLRNTVKPQRLLLFEASAGDAAAIAHDPRLVLRPGQLADVFAVVEMIAPIGKAGRIIMMLDRLERGHELMLGFWEGTLAYSGWINRGPTAHFPEVGQEMPLEPGTVYVYDCHTSERFRGRGIYPRALSESLRRLGPGERALIACLAENTASRKGIVRAGFALREVLQAPRRRTGSETGSGTGSRE